MDITNKLCDQYEITIFTIYSNGELEKQLSNKINVKSLYKKRYIDLNNIKKIIIPIKIALLKKFIYNKYIKQDYDIEIAFLEGPITRLLSVKNKNTKKIAWVHNDISQVFGNGIKSKIKKILDKKIYTKYDSLVFVSIDNLEKFDKIYPNIKNKYEKKIDRQVIYNYIDKNLILKKSKEEIDNIFDQKTVNFLTVARLVPQKAFDRLVKVHKRLIDEGINHKFYVIGDGSEKDRLIQYINKQNVEDTFRLLGKKENPYPYIKNADYFCLLSKFEGYGMVLEEAKILQKPIIITDTAAREAVKDYKNSWILENTEEGIYRGLKDIITNNITIEKNYNLVYDNSNILEKIKRLIEN